MPYCAGGYVVAARRYRTGDHAQLIGNVYNVRVDLGQISDGRRFDAPRCEVHQRGPTLPQNDQLQVGLSQFRGSQGSDLPTVKPWCYLAREGEPMLGLFKRVRNTDPRAVRRQLVAAADAARDTRRWADAIHSYASALELDATDPGLHVQHGNMLKEHGDRAAAEIAYRTALALNPDNADTWLQLGHVLRMLGRPIDAVDAYREALLHDPGFNDAKRELIALGARDMIPSSVVEMGPGGAEFAAAVTMLREAGRRLEEGARLAAHPTRSYNEFRHCFPVLPPPVEPGYERSGQVLVKVDGRARSAAEVRLTLRSLIDQTDRDWYAQVTVDAALVDHPVASIANVDDRIAIASQFHETRSSPGTTLVLRAGTSLDAQAIAWFVYCHARTGCAAIYSDHDFAEEPWSGPRILFSPVLQPQFDRHWFGSGLTPPAAVFVGDAAARCLHDENYGQVLCDIAAAGGRVVHLPRILATVVDVEAGVRDAPADPIAVASIDPRPRTVSPEPHRSHDGKISVIMPTRDRADLLEKAVETLIATAQRPDLLEIIVVDNRSVEDETHSLFAKLKRTSGVSVIPFDEPFNWSRINNIAAKEAATGHLLVFSNNDTQMLSTGWDAVLADALADPDVGLVGARLLYPDRTVQHVGILFGMNDGSPMHEGVGAEEADPGPLGRWVRRRNVAAVTGAFMAMTRQTWLATDGFDELDMPLGYNDVDMCLRVRALGREVLYEPALLLIHEESKTRGHNVTRSQVAWDRGELRILHQRWQDHLFHDPALNPHWDRHSQPFTCFREPSLGEILARLDRRAEPPVVR